MKLILSASVSSGNARVLRMMFSAKRSMGESNVSSQLSRFEELLQNSLNAVALTPGIETSTLTRRVGNSLDDSASKRWRIRSLPTFSYPFKGDV